MSEIKFGTDGWRAVIAEDFTFANVDRVAQATADYWSANLKILNAKRSSVMIAGFFPTICDARSRSSGGKQFRGDRHRPPTPTPSVSFGAKAKDAIGGVMITASHNPPMFNGFKLKAHYGGSADPTICQGGGTRLDKNPVRAVIAEDAIASGKIEISDIRPAHYAAIKKLVDFKLIAKSQTAFCA